MPGCQDAGIKDGAGDAASLHRRFVAHKASEESMGI